MGVLFFFILFFISCSSQKTPPSIFIESNANFYIAKGVGKSEKEAIAGALEHIASMLSSKVSSIFNLRKESSSSSYQKMSQHDIKIEVEKIKFSYNLISSTSQNSNYVITLKVDRKKSARGYVTQLERALKELENELKTMFDLRKYLFLKTYPFHKLYSILDVILRIDSTNSSLEKLENRIKLLEKKRYQYQKELTFSVESKERYLRDIVIDVLSVEKFNISSNAKIKLSVNLSNIKVDEIYGEYYAEGSAVVKMVQNQEIITKLIALIAKPSSTKKGAKANILKAFREAFPKFIKKEF